MITKICEQCKKEFTTEYSTQKLCSRQCAFLSMQRRVHVTCPICGKDMYIHKGEKKYCSPQCAGVGLHLSRVVMKTCPVCGKVFESRSKGQKFCSRGCSDKGRKRVSPTFSPEQLADMSERLKTQWKDEAFRQIVVDRMKTNNPVYQPEVIEKANETRRKNKSCVNNFKYGNGHISPHEELVKNKIESLGFIYNHAIPTAPAREAEPDAHYALNYKPDFVNLATRLCIEIDGSGHSSPKEKAVDMKKERCLRMLGYDVIRFTHEDIDKGVFDEWLNSYLKNM